MSIKRKNIQNYFSSVTVNGVSNSKTFWNAIKPFVSDKWNPKSQNIILNENDNIINDDFHVADIMNDHFVNIEENTMGENL